MRSLSFSQRRAATTSTGLRRVSTRAETGLTHTVPDTLSMVAVPAVRFRMFTFHFPSGSSKGMSWVSELKTTRISVLSSSRWKATQWSFPRYLGDTRC